LLGCVKKREEKEEKEEEDQNKMKSGLDYSMNIEYALKEVSGRSVRSEAAWC
jgi:hypothetical protein